MKKVLLAVMLLFVMLSGARGDVAVTETTFPDPVFRARMLNYIDRYVKSGDIIFPDKALASITSINLHELGIQRLNGIEYFTNLKKLSCYGNRLAELDVSRNTNLEELYCYQNYLRHITLGNNTKLKKLHVYDNRLTALDISGAPSVDEVRCQNNLFTKLNFSGHPSLAILHCNYNENLTKLDVSGCKNMGELQCIFCGLKELNLSKCSSLLFLFCNVNFLKEVNVDDCPYLVLMDCRVNKLKRINLKNNTNLIEVYLGENELEELDVSNSGRLYYLECQYNNLQTLNVNECKSLYHLKCAYNNLRSLDVHSCTNLNYLWCGANKLEALDLSNTQKLQELYMGNNNISELNLRYDTLGSYMYHLGIVGNSIPALELSGANGGPMANTNFVPEDHYSIPMTRSTISFTPSKGAWLDSQVIRDPKIEEKLVNGKITEIRDNGYLVIRISDDKSAGGEYNYLLAVSSADRASLESLKGNKRQLMLYEVDFSRYLTPDQFNSIIPDSVRAYDDDNHSLPGTRYYGTQKLRFDRKPARVQYAYDTGLNIPGRGGRQSMDVSFGGTEQSPLALNGHIYRIFNKNMSYQSAKTRCEELGGHLATVSSPAELRVIRELLRRAHFADGNISRNYWLGGENQTGGNTAESWQWISGEAFDANIINVGHIYQRAGARIEAVPERKIINIYYPGGDKSVISADYSRFAGERKDSVAAYLQVNYDGDFSGFASTSHCGFICEWDPVTANFAPYSQAYNDYINNPDAYGDSRGGVPDPVYIEPPSGGVPAGVDISETRYDPRPLGIMPDVRNQELFPTCWAFSSLGALEVNYNRQLGRNAAPDLSEFHMALFTYYDNRKDKAAKKPDYASNVADWDYLNYQGEFRTAIEFLLRAGTASEEEMPYSTAVNKGKLSYDAKGERKRETPTGDVVRTSYMQSKYPEDYYHPLKLKEAYQLGALTNSKEHKDLIKSLVKAHGAVAIAYDYKGQTSDTPSFYSSSTKGNGHTVLIVGWDEDYTAPNFPAPGAWLCRNSWGASGENKSGYFWMSYSQTIGSAAVLVAMNAQDNSYYGNDTATATETLSYTLQANIFKAVRDDTINEAAFQTRDHYVDYEVYVKTGLQEGDKPGALPEKPAASDYLQYSGYYSVPLDSPVHVKAGECFAVIVRLTPRTPTGRLTGAERVVEPKDPNGEERMLNAGRGYFADDPAGGQIRWIDSYGIKNASGDSTPCNVTVKAFSVTYGENTTQPLPAPGPNTEPGHTGGDTTDNNNPDPGGSSGGSGGGGGGCSTASCLAGLAAITLFILKRRSI